MAGVKGETPYNAGMDAIETPAHAVLRQLRTLLPPDRVLTDLSSRESLARDQLRRRRAFRLPPDVPAPPLAAVLPRGTDDVAAVLHLADELGVPVVEHGGGTGLMGGALCLKPAIVLDMRAMHRVLAVSVEDRSVTVEAGAVLADVGAALAPHGLILGHDPWTYPIATVGGAISTNSLGYRGGRYGSMAEQVLGLTVVLPSGAVVRTRAVPRSSTGPRLHQLFAGAEGVLGVITEATLRVFPLPERRRLLAFDFPSFEHGFTAAQAMFQTGLTPALLDFGAPPRQGRGRMYLGFEGLTEEVEAGAPRAQALCREHGGINVGEEAAREFWASRHVTADQIQAWRRLEQREPVPGEPGSSVFDYLHVALPPSRVLEYVRRCTALFESRGIQVREWGLWYGPELLSVAITRATNTPAEVELVVRAVDEALMLAQDLGGTMEYVHGVGIRYAHLMAREHGYGLEVLRAIKRALDPHGVLNPGKLGL